MEIMATIVGTILTAFFFAVGWFINKAEKAKEERMNRIEQKIDQFLSTLSDIKTSNELLKQAIENINSSSNHANQSYDELEKRVEILEKGVGILQVKSEKT